MSKNKNRSSGRLVVTPLCVATIARGAGKSAADKSDARLPSLRFVGWW